MPLSICTSPARCPTAPSARSLSARATPAVSRTGATAPSFSAPGVPRAPAAPGAPAAATRLVGVLRSGARRTVPQGSRVARVSAAKVWASGAMPKGATVAITGGTGLVGSRLAEALLASGNQVVVLTRDAAKAKVPPGVRAVGPTEWQGALAKATAVVNLAGEPIATRWSDAVKDRILRSRVETTRAVVEALRVLPPGSRPKVMVSASAIGYYGTSNTETFTEKSGPGSDFLARVCREWEAEAARLPEDVRQVVLRIGIVLAKDGGALGKMLPLFAIFAGGPLGSGRQWMSWVHRDDLVALIGAAIADTRYRGAYNATAPQPVRMSEFCSALGAAMGRPSWLPAPEPALKAVLGEGAVVVLEGQKVLPDRAQDTGFVFEYPDIAGAFKDIVK